MHCIESQLEREGVAVTFPVLLAEAVFAGNCMTYVGGVSPYHVVYGRQPALLPPWPTAFDGIETGPEAGEDLSGRETARVREIALQQMVEATSQARLGRALRTRTAIPIEQKFKVGDIVEFHREASSKDVSGWRGPAEIKEMRASSR